MNFDGRTLQDLRFWLSTTIVATLVLILGTVFFSYQGASTIPLWANFKDRLAGMHNRITEDSNPEGYKLQVITSNVGTLDVEGIERPRQIRRYVVPKEESLPHGLSERWPALTTWYGLWFGMITLSIPLLLVFLQVRQSGI